MPLPTTIETVCLYVTHLTRTVCYNTIVQYVSAVWSLHKYLGYAFPDPDNFLLQSTIKGAKRLLGVSTNPALPLTPGNMLSIYRNLDMTIKSDVKFWCALSLSFRCLLRVSHLTNSPHQLLVKDVVFHNQGMDIYMRSSKTIQYKERVNKIPVIKSSSVLCPVNILRQYISSSKRGDGDPLFGYSYNRYNSRLKTACTDIGLKGHFSTHSVRRGSATYLSSFLPIHEVKTYGDWKSWAVLLYLADSYESRLDKDKLVAEELSVFC